MVNPPIEQVLLGVVQGWHHASPHDPHGLKEEMADDVVTEKGERGHDRQIPQLAKPGRDTISWRTHWAGQRSTR